MRLAARHFADAGAAGAVVQDDEVAGEERPMRAAQVEQHAVVPGDGDNPHFGDDGCALAQVGHGKSFILQRYFPPQSLFSSAGFQQPKTR